MGFQISVFSHFVKYWQQIQNLIQQRLPTSMQEEVNSQVKGTSLLKIAAFILNYLILFGLIIAYEIIYQSLFSTIAIIFLLAFIIIKIISPYKLSSSLSDKIPAKIRKVIPIPVQKIIWISYTCLSLAFQFIKIGLYFSQASEGMSAKLQQFLQIDSTFIVFIPLIILPFSLIAIFYPQSEYTILDFKPKINPLAPLPLYLTLCVLMVLIQIFSVSITGLIYFFSMIYLFWLKGFNFKDKSFKVLLIAVQTINLTTISFTLFATCTYLDSSKDLQFYYLFGIDSLLHFGTDALETGHFISEIILLLFCSYLNRLFIYQSMNTIYNELYNSLHIDNIKKFKEEILIEGEIQQENMKKHQKPSRMTQRPLIEQLLPRKRVSDKVIHFQQQVQMKDLSERQSFRSDNHYQFQYIALSPGKDKEVKQQKFFEQMLDFEDEPIDQTQQQKKNRINRFKQAKTDLREIRIKVLRNISALFAFLSSPQFSLRAIQIISIIVIQRYNNVYSFVNLIWLAFVSYSQNLLLIRIFTSFIIFPLQISNFTITYFYNIPYSPIAGIQNQENFGFQVASNIWLDVIIFNVYLNYIILFIKSYREIKDNQQKKQKKSRRKPKIWQVILAFIYRYTYLLTLAIIFFLGFSNPTIINIIYVVIFLVFFSNGDNLIFIKKKKNGRTFNTMTTFSKQYWPVIVYYTLMCIIAKYLYFLFFTGEASRWLDPTGINQLYIWSFNFSLSSTCISNTTPFFIIFVLAEIQIIIYRSDIYKNYSFSIMADFTQGTSQKSQTKLSRFKRAFINFIILLNELYYQCLYYVSGLLIIGCSYRWSFIGLAIIILTCFGLIKSFNKKLLGIILFLNLAFLFLNYLVLLINQYPVISQAIGASFVQKINQISLFIGFSLALDSYASLFVLNILIFYFCVTCYGLSNILQIKQYEDQSITQSSRDSEVGDHRSFREPTIVDTEYQNDNFADSFKKDVVQSTKRFYYENLVNKYKWIRNVGNFFKMFLTDIVTIFVIVQCLYFRLSISMFLFLIVYQIYYFSLFDTIGNIYQKSKFSRRVQGELDNFASKQKVLQNQQQFQSFIADRADIEDVQKFIIFKDQNIQLIKNQSRKKIWKFSVILSVTCLILTYASQFVISDFYETYITFSGTNTIQIILFVIGINTGSDLGNYIYFYYVMLIINIIEKVTISFTSQILVHQEQEKHSAIEDIKQLPKLQNPDYLINCYVTEQFIVHSESKELHLDNLPLISLIIAQQTPQYYKQANLLIYFEFQMVNIRMNVLYGCIHFMIRFYLWLMLINLYTKSNVFGFAYLIAVLSFWFKPVQFSLIKNINKAAIIILLLQYLFLVLDINSSTSPLPLPTSQNLSLLEYLIDNTAWVDFLAVSSNTENDNSYLASFLINSVIIFLTELCFTVYQKIAEVIVTSILALYGKYESILHKLDINKQQQIQVNLKSYGSWQHRTGVFIYQNLIMNSYLIVSLLMFMLLSGVHNYLSIFLLTISFLYIYLGVFSKISERDDIFHYTKIYFRFFNILQLLILLISIILNMPFIPTSGSLGRVLNQFKALTSIEQILLILFIQIWIDLNQSRSFKTLSQDYREKNRVKRQIALRCLAFQRNNDLVNALIREFKQVLSFDNSIAQAMRIIKDWHSTTKRQMKVVEYDFQTVQQKPGLKKIRQQIQQQQINNDHKTITFILSEFVRNHTQISLAYNYYDILKYTSDNISNIISYENLQLSAWRFIKQDYDIIKKMLEEYEGQSKIIADKILENQSQTIGEVLDQIKKEFQSEDKTNMHIINENFSQKLSLNPQHFHQKQKGKINIIAFLLSNIEFFIIILCVIYYMINPCLITLPLIFYIFCYYIIANKKRTQILLIYVFLTIIISQLIQIQDVASTDEGLSYIKFFFYVNFDTSSVYYGSAFLYFLFVVIFANEEIIRQQGSKFNDYQQIENLQKAFLRILINQKEESKRYLWKYSQLEHQFLENINPFNIAAYDLQNNLERLFEKDSSFFSVFSDRKIGIDLYPPIAAIQIFLTIYIIFFYPLMTDVKGYSLQQSTKYYQFSSDMVIGVLVHVLNMVIQRFITVQVMPRGQKIKIKYIYTLIIFLLFSWFIFYLAPYKASLYITSSFYSPSPALVAFSFFYFIYFYLSAMQVKYGYQEFKSLNSLMTRRGFSNYYIISAYTAIPFLYEIKIIMDWAFSSTSLTMYDWFRQFSIYLRAFKSKINYYNATETTVLGQTIPWYYKIVGWLGFIIILFIIFGPMILFSGLNPIAKQNLVVSGSLQLSLQILNGNSFTLYQTSHFSNPPVNYNQQMFDSQGFNNVSLLQQMTVGDIPQQFQSVTYEPYGDSNWAITQPNYNQILSDIQTAINQLSQNKTATNQFQLVVTYQVNRQQVQTIASDTTFYYPSQSSYLNLTSLEGLYATMTKCNTPSYFSDFYISLIRLNTIGNTYKPRPITYINDSVQTGQPYQPYYFNVVLNLFCNPGIPLIENTNDVYWGLYLANSASNSTKPQGLILYVYCDKYQNIIGGYGFTALYTSIILVIAGFVRSMFDGNLPLIPYEMNPKPDNILQICQAINTLRVRRQFRQEYLLYYQLIDIIRSPQIMKHLSGSYPYLIEQAHEKVLQKQSEQQLKKMKTL